MMACRCACHRAPLLLVDRIDSGCAAVPRCVGAAHRVEHQPVVEPATTEVCTVRCDGGLNVLETLIVAPAHNGIASARTRSRIAGLIESAGTTSTSTRGSLRSRARDRSRRPDRRHSAGRRAGRHRSGPSPRRAPRSRTPARWSPRVAQHDRSPPDDDASDVDRATCREAPAAVSPTAAHQRPVHGRPLTSVDKSRTSGSSGDLMSS